MIAVLSAALTAYLLVPPAPLRRLRPPAVAAVEARVPARYTLPQRLLASAGACAAVMLLVPGVAGTVLAVAAGVGLAWWLGRMRPKEDQRAARDELPEALDFLAVCIESGATPVAAVEIVSNVSPPATASLLAKVSAHLAVGRTPEEAWEALREHPVWGLPARDLMRSARSGTGLVEILHAHAEDARAAKRDAELKSARTAGVKSVIPLMACFLPAFILVGVVPIIAALILDFL